MQTLIVIMDTGIYFLYVYHYYETKLIYFQIVSRQKKEKDIKNK